MWGNYSNWMRDEERRSTGAAAKIRAKMAASGLTPGSDAWNERMGAEEKDMQDRLKKLQTGATADMLKQRTFSMLDSSGSAKRGKGLWEGLGGNTADVRKTLTERLDALKARGPNLLFASEEKDINRAKGKFEGQVKSFENQLGMLDMMDKGAERLTEMGIERELKPWEMYHAGIEGAGGFKEPEMSEDEAALENARKHGSGRARRTPGGGAGPEGGMSLGMHEDVDQNAQPWI